jgi:hypothetical protein
MPDLSFSGPNRINLIAIQFVTFRILMPDLA